MSKRRPSSTVPVTCQNLIEVSSAGGRNSILKGKRTGQGIPFSLESDADGIEHSAARPGCTRLHHRIAVEATSYLLIGSQVELATRFG